MLVDELTVSGLLRVLRQMQANDLTVDQINEISGEDLSDLVANLQDIQEKVANIQTAMEECETNASTFKTGIANAIKGVDSTATVTGDSSLPDFTSGIQSIVPNVTNDATATASHILKDKTAYVNGNKVTGTIASLAAKTYTPGTSSQTIAAGQYLSGAQTIAGDADLVAANIKTGVDIFSVTGTFTSDANATASQILSGKTAYVNGNKVTGTIASKAAATYTPGTSDQTIAAGQYLSGAQTIAGDADLIAANIKTGINIFGVVGTFTSDANAAANQILKDKTAYVNGNKVTGTMNNYTGVVTHIDARRIANDRVEFACARGYHDYSWNGNSYEYVTYDEILSLIGCSADKIVSGKSILNMSGTATSDATATAGLIANGYTAYVNGNKITGSLPQLGGGVFGDSGSSTSFDNSPITWGGSNSYVGAFDYPLYGYFPNGTHRVHIPNLLPSNIKAGVKVGGKNGYITGTFTSDATATEYCIAYNETAYVNGSKVTGKLQNYTGAWMSGPVDVIGTNTGGPSDVVRMAYTAPSTGFYVPPGGTFCIFAAKSVLGDASASNVLSGKAFTSSNGIKISGSMNDYSGQTIAGDLTEADGSVVKFRVTTGGYCSGLTKISRPYSTVASALGITAAKIASGQTICGVTGTYTGYQSAQWSVEISPDTESSYFNVLGGNLSSSSWKSACSSTASSQFCAYWSAVNGKLNGSTWAVCKISAPTYGIRRGNGYAASSTTASYRYLSSITIVADELTTGSNTTYHGTTAGMGSQTILIGHWYDCNLVENSTSTHKSCNIDFYINDDGYVIVSFYYSGANTLAFRGNLRFDFQVFYK